VEEGDERYRSGRSDLRCDPPLAPIENDPRFRSLLVRPGRPARAGVDGGHSRRLAPPPQPQDFDLFLGTLAPFFRASESPIAIACFRLFTVPPLPPRPLLSVPFFRRRIALSTRFDAAFPYLRPPDRLEELFRFAVAIGSPRIELALVRT
jgi:hypothetical protein